MTGTYDRIARFYAVDMARNMAFDDVAFYSGVCRRHPGRALELGCGSGRILLELLREGIDAFGIDASAAMLALLAREAAACALPVRACRMDMRALAFAPAFAVVLCPYSLITYVTTDAEAATLLGEVRRLLLPGGVFVVDAFVPKPLLPAAGFTRDYARPFDGGTLVRSKRIVPLSRERNRIERRYDVHDAGGTLVERVEIAEDIRPYTPAALHALVADAGFAVEATAWDYGAAASVADAQFVAIVARPNEA